jgi:predicted proteasome-type protease
VQALVIVKRDQFAVARHASIDADSGYFHSLRSLWSEAFARLPEPDWLGNAPQAVQRLTKV